MIQMICGCDDTDDSCDDTDDNCDDTDDSWDDTDDRITWLCARQQCPRKK